MADLWPVIGERLPEVLGRQALVADRTTMGAHLAGKRVLITGAGGSIGSALSLLLANVGPSSLTLLDLHENSLFQLCQRLRVESPDARPRFVLADVRNAQRIGQVLRETDPEVVFHLAAYKHVPFAEELPAEFVAVNILGTERLIQQCRRFGVQRVVYPSTDKAVNPPSIYGATKRVAELLLQAEAQLGGSPETTIARLVNVLGAWGGVIETFVRQIGLGLPMTITDRRMTRYWITMDEALFLLTAAAAPTGNGNILLLDLGLPISVVAIAERLWAILRPSAGPPDVTYVGSRPGERLAEQLTYPDELAVPTDFPGVLKVARRSNAGPSRSALTARLAHLEALVGQSAEALLRQQLLALLDSEA